MKKYPPLTVILCSFLLVSCAGQSANAQAGDPTFLISTKNKEDRVDVQFKDGVAVFDVYSPGGIGAATIQLETGSMPEQIIVRLHLMGLEEFRITSAGDGIKASVSSSDPSKRNIHEIGSEMPILPVDPLWMQVDVVTAQSEKKIPLEDGYFEITVPRGFIRQAGDSFGVEWIDFYR